MQRRAFALVFSLGLGLAFVSSTALAQYRLTNLDSNQFGQAQTDDPVSVNAWGMARSATSPWWISDEGSGWSTLYNGAGVKQGLVVAIPAAAGVPVGSRQEWCLTLHKLASSRFKASSRSSSLIRSMEPSAGGRPA